MRLTCPNCDAQYEVPDDVIPVSGRDVQCSNCSDTWFQPHPTHPLPEGAGEAPAEQRPEGWSADPAEDIDGANAPEEDAPIPDAAFNPHAGRANEPGLQPAATPTLPGDRPKSEPGDDDADDDTPERAQQRQTNLPERTGRREIDPAVVSVLRAEAEREQRARAAAQSGLETQPEPGLSDEANESRRARAARLRRMTRAQSEAAEPAAAGGDGDGDDGDNIAAAPAARRSLYPAIEEINAAPAQNPGPQAAVSALSPVATAPARQPRAFRSGVLVAVLIAVALLLIYSFATQLADMLPPLGGALADYTAWVDGLRQWLDKQIAALMLSLNDMAATAPVSDISGD